MRATPLIALSLLLGFGCNGATKDAGDDSAGDDTNAATDDTNAATDDTNTTTDDSAADDSAADDSAADDSAADDSSEPECVDNDGDGFGQDCEAGPDCDDNSASCTDDCSDSDQSGQPDCVEGVGADVFLYTGAGGGGYDIDVQDLIDLFGAAGYGVSADAQLPPNLAERYGVLFVLAPTQALPPEVTDAANALMARGGRLVVATEHGIYSHHDTMALLLSDIGSSMVTVQSSNGGWQTFNPAASVAPITDGVSELSLYFTSHFEAGSATVIGSDSLGQAIVGWEAVKRGDVVVVCDGSFFGYALGNSDNAQFVENLADLN